MKSDNRTRIPTRKQVESLIADVIAIQKRIEAFAVGPVAPPSLNVIVRFNHTPKHASCSTPAR